MVYIDIERNDSNITLYCHKGSEQGESFKIVMDAATGEAKLEILRKEAPWYDSKKFSCYRQ